MSNNDVKIKDMLSVIKDKRKALGEKPKASWKTNGVFKSDKGHTNINTVTHLDGCVDIVCFLMVEKDIRKKACDFLEVASVEPRYSGYLIEDWLQDIKLRVAMLNWDIEKKKLGVLEIKLKDLRSEDAKTGDALSDIMSELE